MHVAMLAGTVSTAMFVGSTLPMLTKALRTRDVSSYSRGNLVLATVGNAIYALYVFSLPPGPLWVLHLFHTLATGFMLVWHLRYADPRSQARDSGRWSRTTVGMHTTTGSTVRQASTADTVSATEAGATRRHTRTARTAATRVHTTNAASTMAISRVRSASLIDSSGS